MRSRHPGRLAIVLGLAVLLVGAKPGLDLSDSTWDFPSLSLRTKGSAKKLGKTKVESVRSATITLGRESGEAPITGSFSIGINGEALTGTYTRKKASARKLLMTLDGPSAAALAELEEQDLEAALQAAGVDLDLELQLDPQKSKLSMRIVSKKKTGLATARLKVSMRFTGTSTGEGVDDAPTKVKLKAKGESDPTDDPVDG